MTPVNYGLKVSTYNPITAMWFSAMFIFQLDDTKRKPCRHPIAIMGLVDMFWHGHLKLEIGFNCRNSLNLSTVLTN